MLLLKCCCCCCCKDGPPGVEGQDPAEEEEDPTKELGLELTTTTPESVSEISESLSKSGIS